MFALTLDRIRTATLAQEISFGLLYDHARLLEGLARGGSPLALLHGFLQDAERSFPGWDFLGLVDLGQGIRVVGRNLGIDASPPSAAAAQLWKRLLRLPQESVLRGADNTISAALWAAALPGYHLGHFAVFRGEGTNPAALLAISPQRDSLRADECVAFGIVAEAVALVANHVPAPNQPVPVFTPAEAAPPPPPLPEPVLPPPPAEPEVRLDQICYGLLWHLTNDAICLIDPEGMILSGNDQLGVILGRSVEHVVGQPLENYLAPGDNLGPIHLGPEPQERWFQQWDGSMVRAKVRGSDLADPKGQPLGRLAVMELVPEIPVAAPLPPPPPAATHAHDTDRLGAALRSVGEGIIGVDIHGRVALMNAVAERMTGLSFSQAQGHPIADVCALQAPGSEQNILADWAALTAKTSGWQTDFQLSAGILDHKGEFKIEVSAVIAPIRTEQGEISGALVCLRDATEINNRIRERTDGEHFKSLSLLAGGIAHDLNNILTALVGNISLANILVSDMPEVSDRLVEAERACFRAKDLSHQLLTFSKGGTPVKKIARLEDLINQCVEFYLRGSKSAAKIIVKPGLWSVNVDESQINQVIESLVLNADHCMTEGGNITVTCQNFHYAVGPGQQNLPLEDGFYVKLSIADEGPGIAHEHLEHIFKPYYTTKEISHGLGLATTYTIIKNHRGHISVSSAIGAGTEFTIYLPATGTTKRMDAETPGRLHARREYPGRILVVDDEKSIRDLASTTLELMGCEVVACRSSTEGVQTYLQARQDGKPFDLIIMDLTLPGDLGGNEAMQQILQIAPDARGIASSGYSEGSVMAHYREYGFQASLSKPYNIGDLQRIVSTMLQG